MQKIIVKDKETGIVQITVVDERWYLKDDKYVPSVTWITSFYPKGKAFWKWLAEKGWDESEIIKQEAGNRGSKVHLAIADLIEGKEVLMESKYINKSTGLLEDITLDEYESIMSFTDWFNSNKIDIIKNETVIFNDTFNYAGTVDLICKIDDIPYIVDFKTSQSIWPSHELQLSAYKHAVSGDYRIAILQVGYKRNKNKYKFTEITDKFDLFLAAQKIWAEETSKIVPLVRDYPTKLKLKEKEA